MPGPGSSQHVLLVGPEDTTLWSLPGGTPPKVTGGILQACLSTEAFAAALQRPQSFAYFLPMLEDGGRIVGRSSVDHTIESYTEVVAVEYPPHVRTISFMTKNEEDRPVLYRLAFPWVYVFLTFSEDKWLNLHLFYRNSPVSATDDVLGSPNLYNATEEGYVCMGEALVSPPKDLLFHQQVEWCLRHFWGGIRNKDIVTGWLECTTLSNHPATLWDWERKSQIDPTFILTIPWRTVNTMLHILYTTEGDRWAMMPDRMHR